MRNFPQHVAFIWYPLLLIPVAIALDLWYTVQQFKYFVNRTAFGDVAFTSRMSSVRVVLYLAIYFLLVILGIAATFGVFALLIWLSNFGGMGGWSQYMKDVGPFLMFPLFLLAFAFLAVLKVFWLYYELLRAACRTLDVHNLAFVDQVVQSADDGVRFGEGLADAFDLGDF